MRLHLHKYVIGGAVAALIGVLLVGWTTFKSYVSVAYGEAQQAIKDAEPVEMKLKRARVLMKDIDVPIREATNHLAHEVIGVEKLEESIELKSAFLKQEEMEMKGLAAHLKSGEGDFRTVAGTFTSEDVKRDLSRRLTLCKQHKATLEALQGKLAAKQRVVNAAKERITAMKDQKTQLRDQIELLEAKLEEVKVAETVANIEVDDSELTSLSQLLDEIDTNIRQREYVSREANVDVPGEIPVEQKLDVTDLSEQVDAYFQTAPAAEKNEGPNT
jgi:hypothetical protein